MTFSETVQRVITLADAIRDYWDAELPKRHPNYPFVQLSEDSGPPPAEEKALEHLIAGCREEDIYKLALIMYLGRGDFGTDNLAGEYEALREALGPPSRAASQMLEKVPLADYLRDGLAELEKNGIDAEHLTFTTVNSGNG